MNSPLINRVSVAEWKLNCIDSNGENIEASESDINLGLRFVGEGYEVIINSS
jgi:hypothetical protein